MTNVLKAEDSELEADISQAKLESVMKSTKIKLNEKRLLFIKKVRFVNKLLKMQRDLREKYESLVVKNEAVVDLMSTDILSVAANALKEFRICKRKDWKNESMPL